MFSKRVFFRVVCSEHGQDLQGQKAPNALKHWCFQAFFAPLSGVSSVTSRGEESEKHRLENTIWNRLVETQGSVNGGFQTVVRVLWGNEIPLPPVYLNLTPFLPQFNLILTSFLPNSYLNLTSAQPAISNHGLETMVYIPLGNIGENP